MKQKYPCVDQKLLIAFGFLLVQDSYYNNIPVKNLYSFYVDPKTELEESR